MEAKSRMYRIPTLYDAVVIKATGKRGVIIEIDERKGIISAGRCYSLHQFLYKATY